MPMDEDKVHVSIDAIDNGFVFRRSWSEKKKGKEGDCKYHHDEYFMKSLPGPLKKLFEKGYMKDMMEDDMWDDLEDEKIEVKASDEDE